MATTSLGGKSNVALKEATGAASISKVSATGRGQHAGSVVPATRPSADGYVRDQALALIDRALKESKDDATKSDGYPENEECEAEDSADNDQDLDGNVVVLSSDTKLGAPQALLLRKQRVKNNKIVGSKNTCIGRF